VQEVEVAVGEDNGLALLSELPSYGDQLR
jgi:hypothetical protein